MQSSRRDFFQTMGAGAAGLAIGTSSACTRGAKATRVDDDGPVLQVGEDIAVVETTNGKVRGFVLREVNQFLGIPYGADTTGANRFMPPQKPEPWDDVFPALFWGDAAPQSMDNRYQNKHHAFRDNWNYYDVSENCLGLNVFTPALGDGQKRPVLFWCHGGGFTNGNSIEQDGYHGENLARFGDVVFVSINHRLGPLGYCNLAAVGGDKYALSGNVGILDIAAALEWVRDNIEAFGGDPGNVTVMGQSGGGGKVSCMTTMPRARGLVHKGVVLSGASLRMGDKEQNEKLGEYVLKEAGLKPSEIDKLQEMPWKEFYALANRAEDKLTEDLGPEPRRRARGFNPTVDGDVLPQDPYYPEASPVAAELPMMICSTTNERSFSWTDYSLDNMTLEEVADKIRERDGSRTGYGDDAMNVVQAFAKAYPDRKPYQIWEYIRSPRERAVALADAKSKQTPPVYVAWFGFRPPLFDSRIGAFHCLDICFWFHNTDRMLSHTGGGARPRKLATRMAGALVKFMQDGDPDGAGLPDWPRYTSANGETMCLNEVSEVRNDPDREARQALKGHEPWL